MGGVAILDCGAQYAKVIDRRIRELGVHSDILSVSTKAPKLKSYDAIILSGGPNSVYESGSPSIDKKIFTLGKPILGICYGMQLIADVFGAEVGQKPIKEYGETTITIKQNTLFSSLDRKQQVLMSHGDSLHKAPDGFSVIAMSNGIIAAIADPQRRIYGVQFHPEVDLTLNGRTMLHNFLFKICKLERTHTIDEGIHQAIIDVRKTVGSNKVQVLISGGVDSAVTAALLLKALRKDQVYGIHIDHGFMRKNESSTVMKALKHLGMKHIRLVGAEEEFLNNSTKVNGKRTKPLHEVVDPEEKRKIIGDAFMRVSERELGTLKGKVFLAQGTLRPDLIESASEMVSSTAQTIKTHHNDSSLVREKRKKGLIIETNKDWHKDEVRKIAKKLGLPNSIANRHPFPGPGLAIRLLCAEKPYIKDYDKIHDRVEKLAKRFGMQGSILPVRSVGVQGDGRSYAYVAVINGPLRWSKLKEAAQNIPREVHEVNRVCYVLHGKIQKTKTIMPTTLNKNNLDILREADDVVHKLLRKHKVAKNLAQVPVISLPIGAIVIRPFITNDFMTGRTAIIGEEIPEACIKDIVKEITSLGIGTVLYDLTSKPPGTTEWE